MRGVRTVGERTGKGMGVHGYGVNPSVLVHAVLPLLTFL